MRKILLMAASALLMTSCFTDNSPDIDPNIIAITMHNGVVMQNVYALDPFNVAFRYNTLLIEADKVGGSIGAVKKEIKDSLFGKDVKFGFDPISGVDTITFKGSSALGDRPRGGKMLIKTNGYRTISEANAQWELIIPNSDPYNFGWGADLLSFSAESYKIQYLYINAWNVEMRKFEAVFSSEYASDWNGKYIVKQDAGDQSYDGMKKSTFSISPDISLSTTMFDKNKCIVETVSPMRYSPKCGMYNPSGNGELKITMADITVPGKEWFFSKWLGENVDSCLPSISITYDGKTTVYNQQ